jgi:hypothetical protein
MRAPARGVPGDVPDIELERVTATVDTIELFFVRPPIGLRRAIEEPLGRRIEIKECRDRTGYLRGVRAIINRPNLAILPVLSQLRNRGGCTCRVDVALDFVMESEDAAKVLRNYLEQRVVMKWRPAGRRSWRGTTTYWVDIEERKPRNLCLYWRSLNTIRFEVRFLNSRAVRRAGLDDPSELKHLNPLPLFQHNIKVVHFTDQYVKKAMQRTVRDDRLKHLSKGTGKRPVTEAKKRSDQFNDQYRAHLPRRVRHIFDTMGMQEFVSRAYPDRAIRKVSLDFLQIPTRVDWSQ